MSRLTTENTFSLMLDWALQSRSLPATMGGQPLATPDGSCPDLSGHCRMTDMMTGIERKDFFLKHLKDSKWTAGVVLGRCLACKDRGLIANVITGRWRCQVCGTHGELESLARRLGVSFPQGSHSQSETKRAKGEEIEPPRDPVRLAIYHSNSSRAAIHASFENKPSHSLGASQPSDEVRNNRPIVKGKKIPSDTVQQRQIRRLSARHLEIIERLLVGQDHKRIAQELGLGEQWLSVIVNSPLFIKELAKRLSERSREIDHQLIGLGADQVERAMAIRAKLDAIVPEALTIVQKYGEAWIR
jgi:hypothetical protein